MNEIRIDLLKEEKPENMSDDTRMLLDKTMSDLLELNNRLSILIENRDISPDVISLVRDIRAQEEVTAKYKKEENAYEESHPEINVNDRRGELIRNRHRRNRMLLDQMKNNLSTLIRAKKAIIRGQQQVNELRRFTAETKAAEAQSAKDLEAAHAAQARVIESILPAAPAPAAPALPIKRKWWNWRRKGGKRKTRRSKKSRSKRRQTRSRR